MRFLGRALLVSAVVTATVGMPAVAWATADGGVRPRVWVARVCAAARPAAVDLAARMDAAGDFASGPAPDVEELVGRIQILQNLVSGLRDVLIGLRAGIVDAGVPRIPDARRKVRVVMRDLDQLTHRLSLARDAFARFVEQADTDPVGAAEVHEELPGLLAALA